jgi:hypothetical protein
MRTGISPESGDVMALMQFLFSKKISLIPPGRFINKVGYFPYCLIITD